MVTGYSPGVGFRQVVGAGIDLVDGKKSWAGSTCIITIILVKKDLQTLAHHCDELSGFLI